MIYLDSSVVLAHLLSEARTPPADIWRETLISSRLLVYEVWNRLHARRLVRTHADAAQVALGRLALVELSPAVLERALDAFPVPVRTLDALHLASIEYLRSRRLTIELVTYDRRMSDAAVALGIRVAPI